MSRWVLAAVLCAPVIASADHEHHHEPAPAPDHEQHEDHSSHALLGGMHSHAGSTLFVGLLAGSYKSPLYDGDYQGVTWGVRYGRDWYGISAAASAYRLDRNGKAEYGVGDIMGHFHARAIERGPVAAGAMLMVSIPSGRDREGFGMGHTMVMPEAWVTYTPGTMALAANAGFAYMFGGASAHAEHGAAMWPLVDPMYAMEITFGGTAMIPLSRSLGVGARVTGGVAAGDSLDAVEEAGMEADALRLATGGRAVWTAGRWITTFEMLAGVAGEPFGVRGLLETSRRFY